ncbi:hypothetical protein KCV00_g72, partial [Aureobasidium melanogenum]
MSFLATRCACISRTPPVNHISKLIKLNSARTYLCELVSNLNIIVIISFQQFILLHSVVGPCEIDSSISVRIIYGRTALQAPDLARLRIKQQQAPLWYWMQSLPESIVQPPRNSITPSLLPRFLSSVASMLGQPPSSGARTRALESRYGSLM